MIFRSVPSPLWPSKLLDTRFTPGGRTKSPGCKNQRGNPERESLERESPERAYGQTHAQSPPPTPAPGTGLDNATRRKFARGQMPIDATLDLHGLNQEQALMALRSFMGSQHANGARVVRIITGKGKHVLRDALPRWLERPEFRPLILATALPRLHKGNVREILLRRRRVTRQSTR